MDRRKERGREGRRKEGREGEGKRKGEGKEGGGLRDGEIREGGGEGKKAVGGGRDEFRGKHTEMLRVIILWVTYFIFFIVISLPKLHQLKKSLL